MYIALEKLELERKRVKETEDIKYTNRDKKKEISNNNGEIKTAYITLDRILLDKKEVTNI